MVYSKAPSEYYSTLHDSLTYACKAILPFGLKKRFLLSAEHRLSKLQSDNLKWQQDSFRQMSNLMGLHREDILPEAEVSAFRTHLLDTLLSSRPEQDHPLILRDKLHFLQELLYAKCISEGEYSFSRRPLLLKLAAQGAEIEARNVIVAGSKDMKPNTEEEWSVIDLKDEQCSANKESSNSNKSKQGRKQFKGATSVFGLVSSYKPGKTSMEKSIFESPHLRTNEAWHSKEIPFRDGPHKVKRKPFRTLFHREKREGHDGGGGHGLEPVVRGRKSTEKQWGVFDGFKKWKKSDPDDETVPLPLNERSDSDAYSASYQHFTRSFGEEQDTKLMKNSLHSDGPHGEISIDDKVSADKTKKEPSRFQIERNTSPNLKFLNDQMETISTKLSEDKAESKNYFPRYGDIGLTMVKKEFKDHVGAMRNMRNNAEEKYESSIGWTTFEDDENIHPNLSVHHASSLHSSSINPFSHLF